MLPKGFVQKLFNAILGQAAGVLVPAAVASAGAGNLGTASLLSTVCAAVLTTQAYREARGDQQAQTEAEATFSAAREKHSSNFAATLRSIAAGETPSGGIFSADRAKELLSLISTRADGIEEALARHESLLIHVGQWVERWCIRHETTVDQWHRRLDAQLATVSQQLDRMEGTAADRHTRVDESFRQVIAQLGEISHRLPTHDWTAEIDDAREQVRLGNLHSADALLQRLRGRHWERLSARERFRVCSNLAVLAQWRDDLPAAADLLLQAKLWQPDTPEGQCAECEALITQASPAAAPLAETLRTRHPNSSQALALWLGTRPAGTPLDELKRSVPEPMGGTLDVNYVLSNRAAWAGTFDEAEAFARRTLALDPDNARATMQLGLVLVEAVSRAAVIIDGESVVPSGTGHLPEAIDLLTTVIERVGTAVGPTTGARLRRARGRAYHLLDLDKEAERDFTAMSDLAPDDPFVQLHTAAAAGAERGPQGLDSGIDALRRHLTQDPLPETYPLLASMLAERNGPGDRIEAVQLLLEGLLELSRTQQAARTQHVVTLATLLVQSGRSDELPAIVAGLAPDFVSPLVSQFLFARAAHAMDKPEVARGHATAALALTTESSPSHERALLVL